jgi:hypothetical protein
MGDSVTEGLKMALNGIVVVWYVIDIQYYKIDICFGDLGFEY